MPALLKLLILTALTAAPTATSNRWGHEVFHDNFEQASDANYDKWPDGWVRQRGKGYPHYTRIAIVNDTAFRDQHALAISMNGGNAAVFSPTIPADSLHRYVFRGALRTEGLVHDRAFFSLTFFDGDETPLERFESPPVRLPDTWHEVAIGPVASDHAQTRYVRIGVHVLRGQKADLHARVLCDDVWLGELPRLDVASNRPLHLYAAGEPIEVICRLSGVGDEPHEITFELVDPENRPLASHRELLIASESSDPAEGLAPPAPPAAQPTDPRMAAQRMGQKSGTVRWSPPIPEPGFYRVRCVLDNSSLPVHRPELGLAVIVPEAFPPGEFGWSLPQGERPLPLTKLSALLPHVGIHWLKFPLWFGEQESEKADELVRFIEELSSNDISLVGLLNAPPPEVRQRYGAKRDLSAAELFTPDADPWYASLESVLLRLSMKTRHWQLGADDDKSFAVYRDLDKRIVPIKQKFESVGQRVSLGFAWDWLLEPPVSRQHAWQFLAISTSPPLTAHELGQYLDRTADDRVQRWVTLKPLPRDEYPVVVRAKDLVQRMMAAKIHGADAIFASDVFDDQTGLMRPDGSPSELLLPWRTTASLIGGAEYLGSLQLPGGSQNHLFIRGSSATLVLWNARPSREVLYLGEQVERRDLWGRRREIQTDGNRQTIPADVLPTFVAGVHPAVARWRLATQFTSSRLPSILGRAHRNGIRIENTFPVGVSGQMHVVVPEDWLIDSPTIDFNLGSGESLQRPIVITLPYNANSGRHLIRLDFEITADRSYRFSVYRHLQVGMGDVLLDVSTRLRNDGYLVVEQRIINQSNAPVSFACNLFAPGRRRKRTHVLRLGQGQDVQTYLLPNGKELLGKQLWIRADEIGGSRVLSHRFVAES